MPTLKPERPARSIASEQCDDDDLNKLLGQTIIAVMEDIVLEESELGRLARKLKRMKRDHADVKKQRRLCKPLFMAIAESIMSEPIDRDEKTGTVTMPELRLPRGYLKKALKV
jgi:hypothetical protein